MSDLASRMYPSQAPTPAPADPPIRIGEMPKGVQQIAHPSNINGADTPEPTTATEIAAEQLAKEASRAERAYPDAPTSNEDIPREPEGYAPAMSAAFEPLEREARRHSPEDFAALQEGRQAASALFHEYAVPSADARDMTNTVGRYLAQPVPDADLRAQREATEAVLRKEYGPQYQAKIAAGTQVLREAIQRAPWLRDAIDAGAGNDPAVIRHFVKIAERGKRK